MTLSCGSSIALAFRSVLRGTPPTFCGKNTRCTREAGKHRGAAGNFALQKRTSRSSLDAVLNIRQVGYEFAAFAHHAFRIVVDIDEAELAKPTIFPDLAVQADVGFFVSSLTGCRRASLPGHIASGRTGASNAAALSRGPSGLAREVETPINPYVFVERLATDSRRATSWFARTVRHASSPSRRSRSSRISDCSSTPEPPEWVTTCRPR